MENEKSMITTELLGIRTGLSMISKYTDEIKKREEWIEDENEKIQQKKDERNSAVNSKAYWEKKLEEQQQNHIDLKKEQESLEEELALHKRNRAKPDRHYPKRLAPFWSAFGLIHAIIAFFGGMYLPGLIDLVGIADIRGGAFVGSMFLSMFGIFLYLTLWSFASRSRKETKKYIAQRRRELDLEINNTKQSLNTVLEKINDVNSEINKTQEYISVWEKEISQTSKAITAQTQHSQEAIKGHQKKIEALAAQSRAVNQALRDTYGVFLNESDWQNIDLIIHYVETGRADTLKEALIQVDRQRQNDQLVRAIGEANAAICNHIESAFSRMGEALAQCFERLEGRLQALSYQLADYQGEIAAGNRAAQEANERLSKSLSEKLDMQISATKANALLLEKANRSSDELIHDLRYNQKYWVK